MLFDFATVGVFLLLAYLFVLAALIASRFVAPHNPYPEKLVTYECGEPPIGDSWIKFNNRFYIIAIIFLLFDVEVVFIFPCAVVFRSLAGSAGGWFVFFEILIFVLILIAGLAYVWAKGDLNWVKTTRFASGVKPGELVDVEGVRLEKSSGAILAEPPEKECKVE